MAEDFGILLRGFRERTQDTRRGGRPLTQSRLFELLRGQTGLDLSPRSVGRWERGETSFPAGQRDLLISVIDILKLYGGIKAVDEANALLEAAGYAALDDAEALRLQTDAGFVEAIKGDVSVTQTAPISSTQAQQKLDEAEDLLGVEDELASLKPEQPVETAEIDRHGTRIQVALVANAWRLPVEALVLPAAASGTEVGGGFYHAMLDDLDPPVADMIFKLLLERFPSELEPGTPAAIQLPEDLASEVLPFSPSGKATLIIATLRGPDGALDMQFVDRMVNGVLRLATIQGIQHLAMPIIGTGTADPSAGSTVVSEEKLNVETVTRVLCEALLASTALQGLVSVIVATIEPDVLRVARRRFHAFTNNLAQALANDQPAPMDLLGIGPEVRALAEALVLREVRAPLAVGIIGGWGSGKSTVMGLMWKHIANLRTLPLEQGWSNEQGTGSESAFVGHIYQISFNAWTYAKSNLWASLMHEIFIQLNRQLSLEQNLANTIDPLAGGKLFAHLYDSHGALDRFLPQIDESLAGVDDNLLWDRLRERKKQALKDVQKAEAEVAALRVRRDQTETQQRQGIQASMGDQEPKMAVGVLRARVRGFLDEARTETVTGFLNAENVDEAQVQKLFNDLRGIRTTALLLRQMVRENPWAAVGFSLFCVLVVVGTFALTRWTNWSALPTALARLAAFIPLFLPPIRVAGRVSHWVDQQMQAYDQLDALEREQWKAHLEEQIRQMRLRHEQEMEQALTAAGSDREAQQKTLAELAKQGNLAACDRQLALLEEELKEQRKRVGPTADYVSLVEFVEARLDEATYEKRLGLMHQVERDLDELSDGLLVWDPQDEDERRIRQELFPRGEPRVILYIDDLDRCPPPRVVEVMEAVQLLLNTPLFVVALGLDTRYITRALEKEYREILQREGDPSGMDYIEKIIQIPYRVRPIEPQGLRAFLQAQMEFAEEEQDLIVELSQPVDAEPDSQAEEASTDDGLDRDGVGAVSAPSLGPAPTPPPVTDLAAEVVRFQRADYDDLEACCRQVNLTPRSVKRLVNVLKLIKIFWFRRDGRDQPRAVKRVAIGLLSLSAAYPEIMREVFVRLEVGFRDPTAIDEPDIGSYLMAFKPAALIPDVDDETAAGWQLGRFRADVSGLRSIAQGGSAAPADYLGIALADMTLSTFNLVRSFSFVGDFSYVIER